MKRRRFNVMELAEAYSFLSDASPYQKAKRISDHYCACANTAMALKALVQSGEKLENRDAAWATSVQVLVDRLEVNHARDFGIELDWPRMPKRSFK